MNKYHAGRGPVVVGFAAFALLAWANPSFSQNSSARDELETIIVTASKRAENIQNVPQSVTSVGQQQLEQFHVTQLTDLGGYVPGLQVDSSGTPGQTLLSMRGIAPVSANATVAVYLDDTPIGPSSFHNRGSSFSLDLLPYDIQRVEILQGPQGTLYGANALAGLIKYVPIAPSLSDTSIRVGGDAFGIAGSGGTGSALRGSINTVLINGKLGMTASYAVQKTPGYIDNVISGQEDQNSFKQEGGRVSFLWQPIEAVTVNASALYNRIEADGNGTVALDSSTLKPLFGRNADNNYLPNTYDTRLKLYDLKLTWNLGWGTFTSISSYSTHTNDVLADATLSYGGLIDLIFGLPNTRSLFPLELETKKFTQEFRLQSAPNERLEWLGGLYYNHETDSNSQFLREYDANGAPIPSIDPSFAASLPGTYREIAAFGNLDYHFTDDFDTAVGVRYAKNKQDFQTLVSGPLAGGVSSSPVYHSDEGVWTYNVSPRFKFNDNTMLYYRLASGFQPGGPNTPVPGAPLAVVSSTLLTNELGLKTALPAIRGVLDIALYDIRWKKIQIGLTTAGGFTYTGNGGSAKSQGVEVDAAIRPIRALTLNGTLNYTAASFTSLSPDAGTYAIPGDSIPLMPKWSGSIRSEYEWALSGNWTTHVGAGLRIVGDRPSSTIARVQGNTLKGYAALDLNADIGDGRYSVRIYAKNVTDRRALLSAVEIPDGITNLPVQTEGAVLQPRTIGLALDARF